MKKILVSFLLALMLLATINITAYPVEVQYESQEETSIELNPINHTINVGTIKEEEWEAENVHKIEMSPSPGDPGSDYENRTLEGGIAYLAHDNTFLYALLDSIYCQQQMRLDYGQITFDGANDETGTHKRDMYFFTTYGENHVYFSQQVLYNATLDSEGNETGFAISYCHNMPPQGLTPPLQLWGFYQSSWNEATEHQMFSFKIPLKDFTEGFPEDPETPTLPLTVGMYIELYKSITNDPDANPVGGPFVTWPATVDVEDQSTWGKLTFAGEYVETNTPGFTLALSIFSLVSIVILFRKKRR